MEYTEDADRRELLLHSAYDSDTVRAMERPQIGRAHV
mgnify:CR=1 FL=1